MTFRTGAQPRHRTFIGAHAVGHEEAKAYAGTSTSLRDGHRVDKAAAANHVAGESAVGLVTT